MWKMTSIFMSAFILGSGVVSAKCPFARYRVEGTLQIPLGQDPSGIRVYLFLDGTQRSTEYPGPDFAVPNTDGTYLAEVWLSTNSSVGREKCDRIEAEGDLVVVGDLIYAQRTRVRFGQSKKKIREALQASVNIKPIALEKLNELSE